MAHEELLTRNSANTGTPCTEDGYMNLDIAEKFENVTYEALDAEARKKFGKTYEKMDVLANAAIAAFQFLNQPRPDQIQLMNIAHVLLPIIGLQGVDFSTEFVLYQTWLTKRAGLKVEGIQNWDEYFLPAPEVEKVD